MPRGPTSSKRLERADASSQKKRVGFWRGNLEKTGPWGGGTREKKNKAFRLRASRLTPKTGVPRLEGRWSVAFAIKKSRAPESQWPAAARNRPFGTARPPFRSHALKNSREEPTLIAPTIHAHYGKPPAPPSSFRKSPQTLTAGEEFQLGRFGDFLINGPQTFATPPSSAKNVGRRWG